MTGDRPPPCHSFTLTKISGNKAVLFGGLEAQTNKCMKDVYVAELSKDMVVSECKHPWISLYTTTGSPIHSFCIFRFWDWANRVRSMDCTNAYFTPNIYTQMGYVNTVTQEKFLVIFVVGD